MPRPQKSFHPNCAVAIQVATERRSLLQKLSRTALSRFWLLLPSAAMRNRKVGSRCQNGCGREQERATNFPNRRMTKGMQIHHVAKRLEKRQFKAHDSRTVLYPSMIFDVYTKRLFSWILCDSLKVQFVLCIGKLPRHGRTRSAETMVYSDQERHDTSCHLFKTADFGGFGRIAK